MRIAIVGLILALALGTAHAAPTDLPAFFAERDFFAFAPSFTGGVHVALCGFDEVGRIWYAVGSGPGQEPVVSLYRFDPTQSADPTYAGGFLAYAPLFTGGVTVGCTYRPDGDLLIMTGAGPGGGPHVRLIHFRGRNNVTLFPP